MHRLLHKCKKMSNIYKIILEGGLGDMKQILQKGADFTLSVMEAVAVAFANCQCMGRAYEPEMPDELKQDNQD